MSSALETMLFRRRGMARLEHADNKLSNNDYIGIPYSQELP